jgi:hypothetical protein
MDGLIKEIEKLFEKYIEKKIVAEFLKEEKNRDFGRNYWLWFKFTNVLKITEDDLKNSYSYSQKLGLRIVLTFSLIEGLYDRFGENVIISFFSNLNIEEQFLFNWIIEMKDPTRDEEAELLLKDGNAARDHRKLENLEETLKKNLLLYYLLNQREDKMKKEFEERLRYLYALRSQIVHQGKLPFLIAKFGPFHEGIIKIAIINSYSKKNIQDKALAFKNHENSIKFEDVLEDLVFISLLRNKNIKINENFSKVFKEKFWRFLDKIQKFSNRDLYPSIWEQLNQYLIKNHKIEFQEKSN